MAIDILLVNPVFLSQDDSERELGSPYFPLGLLYLAAFLRERGRRVGIFDGTFSNGLDDFQAALREHDPRAVGITAVQPSRATTLRLAEAAHDYGATVILGGPDPTYTPQTYLANPAVDLVVHHEGEITLDELLDTLLRESSLNEHLSQIDGIAYRGANGERVVNPRRPYILNLDELPFPARDLIDIQQYLNFWRERNGYASLSISVARGCPYGCKWCQDSVHGQDFRQRSPQNVAAEVKALMETYQIDRLRVVDDVDGIPLEWFETWEEAAEEQGGGLPFEALYQVERQDVPMMDIRDIL
ncbi:MAG: cobalamin-dependent protein [Anaerolineales bacterium]|jgi:radical SAM superfamily enzyme YgiQ (UPF0313 family)